MSDLDFKHAAQQHRALKSVEEFGQPCRFLCLLIELTVILHAGASACSRAAADAICQAGRAFAFVRHPGDSGARHNSGV